MTIHEPQIDTPGEPADRHCKEKMKILEILIAEVRIKTFCALM